MDEKNAPHPAETTPEKPEQLYKCKTCKKDTAIETISNKTPDGVTDQLDVCCVCKNFHDAEPVEEITCKRDGAISGPDMPKETFKDGLCPNCIEATTSEDPVKSEIVTPPEKPAEAEIVETPQAPAIIKDPFAFIPKQPMDYDLQGGLVNSMHKMAEQFFKSGGFTADCRNVEQVFVKMQAGREMGLRPMEAMSDLVILYGQVAPWGKGLAKRFRKFGYSIKYTDEISNFDYKSTRGKSASDLKKLSGVDVQKPAGYEEDRVTVTVTKLNDPDQESYEYKVTLAEAETVSGNAMKIDRRSKMRYFGLSRIARQEIPEILGPCNYCAEEITPEMATGVDANIDAVNDKKQQLRNNKKSND